MGTEQENREAIERESLVEEYSQIIHADKVALDGSETNAEIQAMISELYEKINHADAVKRFNDMVLVKVEKPLVDLMSIFSGEINTLCDQLEAEDKRLVEKERVDGLYDRFNSLEELTFRAVHPDIPNKEAWVRDLMLVPHDEAIAAIEALEAADVTVKSERIKAEELAQLESDGAFAENLCKRIYRMIVGYNKNNLPVESFPVAVEQYGLAQSHLRNYWPSEAKAEIIKVRANDVYPEDFKNLIISVFEDAGY